MSKNEENICVCKKFYFFNFIFINIWRFNIMINYSDWLHRGLTKKIIMY